MYCWSLPRLSFHPVLPVTVNTLVSIFKLSPLDLKVCVTCFRRTEAKQSKEIQKRKVLFSYARHAFIVELPLLLFFCLLVCFVLLWKIIRSRRKRPWSYRSLGWNWLPNTYHLLEVRASMDILRRVSKNHPSRKPQGVRLDCDDGSHRHSTKTCVKSSIHVGNSEMLTWYPTYYLIPWGWSLWRLIYVVDLTPKKCLGP